MFFGAFDFFQKTNENKSTWGNIVVKSNSFGRFLEESSAWKNHYNFVWPLGGTVWELYGNQFEGLDIFKSDERPSCITQILKAQDFGRLLVDSL